MDQLMIYIRKLHATAGIKLYISLFGMAAVSMLDGIGTVLLVPMLSIIGLFDVSFASIPYVSLLTGPLTSLSEKAQLPAVLAISVLLIVGQAYLKRRLAILDTAIEQQFIRHMRLEVYQSLLLANWSYFVRKRKSDFIHIATSELARVNYAVYAALRLAASLLFTAVQLVFALSLSAPFTACILVCGLALAAYSRTYVRRSRALGEETTELSRTFYAGLTDHLNGIKDIKSNQLEITHLSWMRSLTGNIERNNVHFARLQTASQFLYKLVSALLIAFLIYFAYDVIHVEPANLILIILLFSRLWPKFAGLQSGWEQLAGSLPAFHQLSSLLDECKAAQESELMQLESGENKLRIAYGIECRNLSYRYDSAYSAYALQDINLWIPANRMTAIVGRSGAGKSTLIDMLIGMVKPEQGEVLVDGEALGCKSNAAFRSQVSYVSQEPFLFHATLRENLAVAAPEATEQQMWEALKFAASDTFVRKLPQGLDTVLGDRGIRLSGGERQRIVLARAILRQPAVLVLDEATSALDGDNESRIQEALEKLRGTMTVIVIAHRLSTIRNADQVVVLEQGKVVRVGGYQQLASETDGVFGQLLGYQSATVK